MTTEEPLRPQSLMLTFLGDQVFGRDVCVYSGSIIDVFARAGIGEQATRSTLTRMVSRGLLRRQRAGRRMYFGLTGRSAAVLADGDQRIWHTGAVNRHWDGTWTLLGFSLPESWQRQRHDLRSQLTWSGFGALFNGLWIAPGEVDVSALLTELGLSAHVKVFRAHAEAGMDIGAMIEETWELAELAARYEAFVRRWQPWETELPAADDSLSLRLVLQAEWLGIIRDDPRLPVKHLPDGWAAEQAEKTFRTVYERLTPLAQEASERLVDLVPVREDQTDQTDQTDQA
ncbi:PaaX family transcriptional regulator [Streptomyces sp. NBC_00576]|uniref:PaaX family transcriptional regulator n=1 Tax=Streptomyces sp. NBC_00576 TaxID=2903665 RepID=UPI002E7FE128|nr:PaaX family transcriptional regulator C-terminal domain-containing protein [Streptomyces sp. NBC_00576]WUB69815.1 PaaX family transcriptional regulator [Streptomyces sp. NBC_00576]